MKEYKNVNAKQTSSRDKEAEARAGRGARERALVRAQDARQGREHRAADQGAREAQREEQPAADDDELEAEAHGERARHVRHQAGGRLLRATRQGARPPRLAARLRAATQAEAGARVQEESRGGVLRLGQELRGQDQEARRRAARQSRSDRPLSGRDGQARGAREAGADARRVRP